MKLTKLAQSPIQHVLIFGPPKSGKTELLNELTKIFNLIYIGCEKGHAPLYKLPLDRQEKVEIIDLPDTKEYPIAIETILKVLKGNFCHICDAHGKIDCPECKVKALSDPEITFTDVELNKIGSDTIVVIDSLTQLTESAIAHIYKKLTKGKTEEQAAEIKFEYDEWGELGRLMGTILSRVQQAPYHIICISHETEAEMEDGKKKIVPVAGTRNFSRNSAKAFDHVIYANVYNMKHEFKSKTTSTVNTVVGSRTDVDLQAGGSLTDIFTGKIGAQKPADGNKNLSGVSNGAKAVGDLAALAAKMKS